MRILLTGATGFIGGAALDAAIARPDVERVTCVGRRRIEHDDPKIAHVLLQDFTQWAPSLIESHDACIWALGGKASDVADDYARVTHDYTLACAEAAASNGRPFTFVYVSGLGAAPSGRVFLPWERETRILKGRTERDLLALHARVPNFVPVLVRPGGVLPVDVGPWLHRLLPHLVIRVDELARALAELATTRTPRTVSNAEARAIGGRP